MYLASFRYRDRDAIGAHVSDTHLIDLAEAAKAYGDGTAAAAAFSDMHAFIEAGPATQRQAEQLLSAYRYAPDKVAAIPLTEITWHPPVRRPGKICCIALNNSASDSRRISGPNHPMFFLKPRSCLVGHEQDIVVRPHYGGLHPEPELAVVIGRTAKDLDPRSALDAVFGYSIINDITGNEMRAQDRVHYYALYASKENPDQVERREQHLSYTARYKGSDTFGPMGPWLATRDEVPDPHALEVTCSVAGILLAEDSTRYLTYSVPEVLAYISRYHTLEAGDVIAMGTAFRPSAQSTRSLHTGDLSRMDGPVEVAITGLGTLRNGVRRLVDDPGDWRLPKA